MIKTLIIRGPGTNCELETKVTFELAGSAAEILPLYNILKNPILIHNFHILVLPGGFSFGDYLGSGTVYALKLRKIMAYIYSYLKQKKMILGICNGFQILVKAGLLPDWTYSQVSRSDWDNKVTLTFNKSGRFEARWVKLKIISKKYDYIKSMGKEYISLPVAHGEGRFFSPDKKTIENLYKNGQVLFGYLDSSYPNNPNGSLSNIAGISCPYGQVIGIMPHPERFYSAFLYPHWQYNLPSIRDSSAPDGLLFIKSIIQYIRRLQN